MPKTYLIPLQEIRREQVVVNSRFVATLVPVFSIEEARGFLARIKKEFSDARHNVPAYIIGGGNTVIEYFSDDGEPSGTAGKPVLAVLRGSGLGDVAAVVTGYFGEHFWEQVVWSRRIPNPHRWLSTQWSVDGGSLSM